MIRNRPWILIASMLFLATAYFYQDPEWNGNSRLDLTRAIVEKGTFSIDGYESQRGWSTGDKAFYAGHFYSDKAVGSSLLAVPLYFLLYQISRGLELSLNSEVVKHLLTITVIGTSFTVCGLMMYLIACKITKSGWKALIPALGLSLGTMLWPYSAVYYGHVVVAALLIVAFYFMLTMDEAPGTFSYRKLFWAGIAVGLAFITEYTAALVIAGLAIYGAYAVRQLPAGKILRAAIVSSLGALLPLSMMLAYNYTVYGSPLATGYAYETEDKFLQGMSQGIMGLHKPSLSTLYHITIDPQFGLLWQSPILILAPIGCIVALMSKRYRAAGLVSIYSIATMLAMNGGYYLWWGGSAFGPRLIIPALPFFIVPLALLPEGLFGLTGVLAIVSSAQMLIPLMGQIQFSLLAYRPNRHMFYVADAPFTGFSLLYNYGIGQIMRQYALGRPSWTLGAAVGIPYWLSMPTLVCIETVLILTFRRVAPRTPTRGSGNPKTGEQVAMETSRGSPDSS